MRLSVFLRWNKSHYKQFEPPFEIPDSWEWCQVEDIFELNPKNSASDTSLCGFIPMALVQDGFGFSHSYERRVWRDVKKGYSHFQNGDIGIAKISPCFENRKSTIFYGLPNGIGAGTTELTILRPIIVDAEFYLYLFQSIWYITEGTKDFTGVVGQQRVNKEIFTSLVIPIPPIAEQKRIATEIKHYFHFVELIEYNKDTLIRNTLTTKSKILELAMQGKLVPQDPTDEPAAEMLKRINPNAKIITNTPHSRNIPNGWCLCELRDLCTFLSRGKSPKYSDVPNKYPVFAQKCNLKDGGISLNQARFLDESTLPKWPNKYKLKDQDILVNSTGTGTVGRTRLFLNKYLKEFPFVVPDSHVSVVRTFDEIDSKFIYFNLISREGQTYFNDNLSGSTNQKELYIEAIGNKLIFLPPKKETERIITKIEELYHCIYKIEATLLSC